MVLSLRQRQYHHGQRVGHPFKVVPVFSTNLNTGTYYFVTVHYTQKASLILHLVISVISLLSSFDQKLSIDFMDLKVTALVDRRELSFHESLFRERRQNSFFSEALNSGILKQ